jgi:hypothetical protein
MIELKNEGYIWRLFVVILIACLLGFGIVFPELFSLTSFQLEEVTWLLLPAFVLSSEPTSKNEKKRAKKTWQKIVDHLYVWGLVFSYIVLVITLSLSFFQLF